MIYVLCLAVGTYSHAAVLIRHGMLWNYGGRSLATVLFWSSLTFLDPFCALLLFVKPRAGAVLLVLLMTTDVAHNTWFVHVHGGVAWMVADQWAFLVFVLATMPTIWRATRARLRNS